MPVTPHRKNGGQPIKAAYRPHTGVPGELLLYLATQLESYRQDLQSKEEAARSKRAHRLRLCRARAYRSGQAAGSRQAEVDALNLQARLLESYDHIVSKAHHDCLNLALSCAREIMADHALTNTTALWERVKRGVKTLLDTNGLSFHAHPSQVSALQALSKNCKTLRIKEILPNDQITPGNVRIETLAGSIELSWEEHFELISKHLRHTLNQRLTTQNYTYEPAGSTHA